MRNDKMKSNFVPYQELSHNLDATVHASRYSHFSSYCKYALLTFGVPVSHIGY